MVAQVTYQESPLSETLTLLATHSPYLVVKTETEGDGWRTARDLFDDSAFLADSLKAIVEQYDNHDMKIAASFFLLRYTWMVGVGIVGAYMAGSRVPRLTLDSVALQFEKAGYPTAVAFVDPTCAVLESDPRADDPSCHLVDHDHTLQAFLRTTLESHCADLIAALRPHTPLGQRAMWGLATDRHAQLFLMVSKLLGTPTRAANETAAMATGAKPRFSKRTTIQELCIDDKDSPELLVKASSCCLSYKLPGSHYCSTCPLITDEERIAKIRTYRASA
jgi:ferric iron reductase protein FhuF